MADKLVTLQDENQQPIYPETRAAAVKTADGRILEELLGAGGTGGVPEAPKDGKTYGRNNGAWVETAGGSEDTTASTILTNVFTEHKSTVTAEEYQALTAALPDDDVMHRLAIAGQEDSTLAAWGCNSGGTISSYVLIYAFGYTKYGGAILINPDLSVVVKKDVVAIQTDETGDIDIAVMLTNDSDITLKKSGDGTKYLADDGTYKEAAAGAYYLTDSVINLTETTEEALKKAFGGEDALHTFVMETVIKGKPVYIRYTNISKDNSYGFYLGSSCNIPVSNWTVAMVAITVNLCFAYATSDGAVNKRISFAYSESDKKCSKIEVSKTYLNGYTLDSKLYDLTSDSTSDEVSAAVGGEDGMKKIIKAMEDRNSFFIPGEKNSDGVMIRTQVLPNICTARTNGDMVIMLAGIGYGIWGGNGNLLTINYTKSSNTFSSTVTK